MKKRILSLVLALTLLFGMMSMVSIEADAAEISLSWPCESTYVVTCLYYYKNGREHSCRYSNINGMDIAGGGNILAAESGTVHCHDYQTDGFGNYITITHADGSETLYAHLKSISVSDGQKVKKGQVIGVMGNSGNEGPNNAGMGVHLHFEHSASDPFRTYFKDNYYSLISFEANCYSNNKDWNSDSFICDWISSYYEKNGSYYYWNGTAPTTPVNLGESFTAPILNKRHWKIIENNNGIVQTANETGKSNQLWKFERQSDGSYKISSCYDGRCLDVANASGDPEAPVWVADSNDSNAQRWFIYEESDGYVLKAKCTNCVLDLPNNDPTNGNQLQMYTQNGTGAQIWAIYDGDECKLTAPTLAVASGTTTTKTTFTWDNIYGETGYDVKIWKGTAFEGDAYHIEWDTVSGWGIQLPAGTYQAYIDASNYYETKRSNIVTFHIEESEYTVSYDANGGTGAPATQIKQPNADLTLSATIPVKFPYIFECWESAEGNYEPGELYTENASVTLTARWHNPIELEMHSGDAYVPAEAPILYGDSCCYYYFAPEESAYYRFAGIDDVDNLITLFDEDGNQLAADDDSGKDRQFDLEFYLQADNLYFLKLEKYSSTLTGEIEFLTFRSFNVTYDANGGKNASAPARWYVDEGYMVSDDIPSRTGYTFRGWALEADATEPEFYPGEELDIPMDVTLYAVWEPLSYLFYGDLNQDRAVDLTDVNIINKYLNGTYTPAYDTKEFLLRADLDHDGILTTNDQQLINTVKLAQLTQEEIEEECIGVSIGVLPETEYVLGQEYDTDGLTLLLDFGTHSYPIKENLNVSGYNPDTLGEQKITVTFYQYSASYTITVHPEEEPILYGDVNSDGKINAQDRMVLTRYLAGMTGYTADMINMKAADVNCDGRVNAQDRMILTRYLAQWTAYPKLPHLS